MGTILPTAFETRALSHGSSIAARLAVAISSRSARNLMASSEFCLARHKFHGHEKPPDHVSIGQAVAGHRSEGGESQIPKTRHLRHHTELPRLVETARRWLAPRGEAREGLLESVDA